MFYICRNRGQPFLLYVALAHMHVPLFHNRFLNVTAKEAYAASLHDMDSLVGSIKCAADAFGMKNTLLWFTGKSQRSTVIFLKLLVISEVEAFCNFKRAMDIKVLM